MTKKKSIALPLAVIAGAAGLPTVAAAQMSEHNDADHEQHMSTATPALAGANLILRVDGMSCPFCAFGLEKRLGELATIDTVVVNLSDGIVAIRQVEGTEIDDQLLRDTVADAGFSLREITRPKSH